MPRPTPLLGFKAPFVKGGEIVVPVLVGSGDWAELVATPRTWSGIAQGLAALGVPAPTAEPCRPVCVRVPHTKTAQPQG